MRLVATVMLSAIALLASSCHPAAPKGAADAGASGPVPSRYDDGTSVAVSGPTGGVTTATLHDADGKVLLALAFRPSSRALDWTWAGEPAHHYDPFPAELVPDDLTALPDALAAAAHAAYVFRSAKPLLPLSHAPASCPAYQYRGDHMCTVPFSNGHDFLQRCGGVDIKPCCETHDDCYYGASCGPGYAIDYPSKIPNCDLMLGDCIVRTAIAGNVPVAVAGLCGLAYGAATAAGGGSGDNYCGQAKECDACENKLGPACADGTIGGITDPCVCDVCLDALGLSSCKACSDGRKDGTESDVDCGGSACARCADGRSCRIDADCDSAHCVAGTCSAPPPGPCDSSVPLAIQVQHNAPLELDCSAIVGGGWGQGPAVLLQACGGTAPYRWSSDAGRLWWWSRNNGNGGFDALALSSGSSPLGQGWANGTKLRYARSTNLWQSTGACGPLAFAVVSEACDGGPLPTQVSGGMTVQACRAGDGIAETGATPCLDETDEYYLTLGAADCGPNVCDGVPPSDGTAYGPCGNGLPVCAEAHAPGGGTPANDLCVFLLSNPSAGTVRNLDPCACERPASIHVALYDAAGAEATVEVPLVN